MSVRYHELDGVRLTDVQGVNVWLIFHGQRHRIISPKAYEALFSEVEKISLNPGLDQIESGDDIGDETCLVRFEGEASIYLASRANGEPILYHIATYETFTDFGFDEAKVQGAPAILRNTVQRGEPLVSAPDRAGST